MNRKINKVIKSLRKDLEKRESKLLTIKSGSDEWIMTHYESLSLKGAIDILDTMKTVDEAVLEMTAYADSAFKNYINYGKDKVLEFPVWLCHRVIEELTI